MMAKRDADLTSPDKNEVIPSRTLIFSPGGGNLGISDGGVPYVTSKWTLKMDQVPEFFLKVQRTPEKLLLFL